MDLEVTFPGGKRVDAHDKGFTIKTDQTAENGGEDLEPTPFDLFLASMGTCAGIYVLSFCQQRELPTEGITLAQSMERDPETGLINRMIIDIRVPENFPEKYRPALVRAAEQCMVKRHVSRGLPEFILKTSVYQSSD